MKSLILVGTGIKTISHMTEETKGYISSCDLVLYLVNEPILKEYIQRLAKSSESLDPIYFKSKLRQNAYEEIAKYVHLKIKNVESLCMVIYGHPCIFATPGLLALASFSEPVNLVICPGISAQDCLFADLRFDPAIGGVQTFDATEYILYKKTIDLSCHVVIYQIGMIGNLGPPSQIINIEALVFLKNKLLEIFYPEKKAVIYEAALYPGTNPLIRTFLLKDLDKQKLTTISTLYIPPDQLKQLPDSKALELLKFKGIKVNKDASCSQPI